MAGTVDKWLPAKQVYAVLFANGTKKGVQHAYLQVITQDENKVDVPPAAPAAAPVPVVSSDNIHDERPSTDYTGEVQAHKYPVRDYPPASSPLQQAHDTLEKVGQRVEERESKSTRRESRGSQGSRGDGRAASVESRGSRGSRGSRSSGGRSPGQVSSPRASKNKKTSQSKGSNSPSVKMSQGPGETNVYSKQTDMNEEDDMNDEAEYQRQQA